MRGERSLVALLVSAALTASGCHNNFFQGPDPKGPEQGRLAYNLPPAQQLMEPGPGVGGPGPGVIPPMGGSGMGMGMMGPGVMPASFGGDCGPGGPGGCGGPGFPGAGFAGCITSGGTSQIAFLGEDGIQVTWDVSGPCMFDSSPLVVPGRQDFAQASIYRLRLSGIPGREAIELFPTMEVAPVTPRTDAFLAHSPIPVQFTVEDFDQVTSGNFVTKVIYLPDPEFQELTLSGVETLVSTRLDPGVDPIAEADRRGSILAILRMGNKDLRGGGRGMGFGPMGPGGVMCASHQAPGSRATAANFQSEGGLAPTPVEGMEGYSEGMPAEGGYENYNGGRYDGGGYTDGNCAGGNCANGSCGVGYGGGGYGYGGNMPLGMPTAGYAPPNVPPHMIAGGPTWGMPMTGTPIGLPGPPHIPLGGPAGLQRHVMKNRTRIHLPPPVTQMTMSVKQRPGMNYPRPVNHVQIDEVHREPGGLFPGISNWLMGTADAGQGGGPPRNYDPACQEQCQMPCP
jgi:hypothetical protein